MHLFISFFVTDFVLKTALFSFLSKAMPHKSVTAFQYLSYLVLYGSVVLRVSYCDHSPSVGISPSVRPFTFSCLLSSIYKHQPISTKLGQRIYITIRSRMSMIFGVVRLEHLELFALELEKLL